MAVDLRPDSGVSRASFSIDLDQAPLGFLLPGDQIMPGVTVVQETSGYPIEPLIVDGPEGRTIRYTTFGASDALRAVALGFDLEVVGFEPRAISFEMRRVVDSVKPDDGNPGLYLWKTLDQWIVSAGVIELPGTEWQYREFKGTLASDPFIAFTLAHSSSSSFEVYEFRNIGIAPRPASLAGDLNGDGVVDGADLGIMLAAWGTEGPGDIDGNGIVDGADLGLLLGQWG
ncbi:MAG TPA: hypothetical protein PKC43_03825 [Phycisphaerales bacterium]|nr:hypothetical protein [Phycisphaerales bacterium]HMP36555.1 hypothetical protein [Phycisphaerales bacterium]